MSHTLIETELPLLARLGAGVVVIDPAGRVARWSETAAAIFGVAVDEALGRPWSECVTLIRGDEAGATLHVEIGQQGGWHGPLQVRTRTGQIVGLRAHLQQVVLPEFGDGLCSVALFWEGLGPDLAVSGPEAAQLPYRELFRSSSECLFLIKLDGRILDVTAASAALLDVKPAELLGRDIVEFVEGGNELAEGARSELVSAGSIHRQIRVARPDGTTFPADAFISLASPDPAGLAFVRVRDTSNEERQRLLEGELAVLARSVDLLLEVEEVARRAIEIAGSAWGAIAALALLDGVSDGVVAGSNSSEVIRATLLEIGKDALLVRTIRDSDEPLRLDLHGSHQWDKRARSLGLTTLWAMPLTFDSNRIGTMVLFWGGNPPASLDTVQAAHTGRQVGVAVGGATTRATLRRETLMRESLATPARVGSVVLEQMTDSILTTDAAGQITTINSAGERLYGLSREETVGHALSEVIEQLGLGGLPLDAETGVETSAMGYWQGRVVHRPLIGSRAGQQIVVDLSQTTIRDDRRRAAGLILMSREVTASARLETEAAALSSLAVATERARSRHEVAEVALERLCETTLADAAIIVTWEGQPGENPVIEAARGLGQDFVDLIRPSDDVRLGAIFDVPGAILPLDEAMLHLAGTELHRAATHEGLASGFVVGLRLRDRAVGFLGLASRNPYWIRPSDAVILQAGAQIMGALENARLMERLEQGLAQERRLTAQLEGLIGLTQLPSGDVNESTIAQFLLSRIIATLGARSGFLVRLAGHDRFRVVASLGLGNEMTHMLGDMPVEKVAFWQRLVATGGHNAFLERVAEDPENPGMKRMLDAGLTSYAVFPVLEGDAAAGAFVCQFAAHSEAGLTANERTIDALGRIISIAYANVRMTEGLNEAAEHERRLTAELRALQELTLMGATDDLDRLAQETTEAVVVSTGAAGGGYILIDPESGELKPALWVGQGSKDWDLLVETGTMPPDLPSQDHFLISPEVWLSRATPTPAGGAPSGARAVLPLWVDGKLAGMLNLEWSTSPRVEQFDDHFLEPIARICSISLANFRLRAETLHREATQKALGHRLDTLDELTRIGEEASSFDELAHRTVSLVREALGATGVCYLLIEPGNHFDTKAVAGDIGAFRHWLNGVPAKDAPGGPILLGGSNSSLSDFSVGRVNERVLPLARAANFRSFGAIPIRTGEELAGALLCFFEQPVEALPIDETALDSVARIGGIALANYHLRARLVTSEERYRTLFEESPDALFVTALDGTVLDANDAAVRLYRVNRGEVLGRYLGQFIVADEREMARRRQIVWAHGRGTFTDRGRRSDGSEFQVEIEVRVVELGGQRRFLTLVRDLSDQERLMGELAQAQKMEAIGHLVSGVAHELNNPLAAIIAFSQLIRTDQRLPDDMKHDAGLLVQEADRTRRIVQGLLDFARQRPPDRSRASISALIKSVLELQSYALSANNVEVVMDIPSDLPEVDLDRAQMQQVLLNLTINAIQAIRAQRRTSPGLGRAHLWISAVSVEAPRGSGGSGGSDGQRQEARVRITVRDDGPGVPEAARARLFDPFFTTKQPGEGTGLGLSVSFGIVAAHGGHLWYEPGPANVGSSFMVELPVHARPTTETAPNATEAPAEQGQPATAEPGRRTARGRGAREAGPAPKVAGGGSESGADGAAETHVGAANGGRGSPRREARAGTASRGPSTAGTPANGRAHVDPGLAEGSDNSRAASMITEGAGSVTEAPKPARPRILALDDEFAIRAFLTKVLDKSGMDCDSYQDGAQALAGLAANHYDAMLIDHRMAGMSGTDFYEAATESQPRLAKRAIFMSGDVLNPDLKGFATQRGVRLLAKPFDIDAVIRVVREAISDAEAAEAR